MKPSPPSKLRRLRLEAADAPRVDLSGPSRREHDLLGHRDVPASALYGIQTLRAIDALETGRRVYDLVCERGRITRDQLDRLLNPESMTSPRQAE